MAVELQPGDMYAGNIRILDILGAGSFARVYKVEAPGHTQSLALKLTREPVTAGDEAQRALREITILRSLTNNHVVRTYDCGLRPDGHIYMLMDHLQGTPLDARGFEYGGLPDRVVIYRGPILRITRTRREVIEQVQETVLHELGHHFGLEEDDLPF